MAKKMTFGVIIGNRGFFPDRLVRQGRKDLMKTLKKLGYAAVILDAKATKLGAVETFEDAKKCAALFNRNINKIDGIIVSLPNFGDEKGVANALKNLIFQVPVLIQAEPDMSDSMKIGQRRDSFCGKISVCNNLIQYNIPFTNTALHTESVTSDIFDEDLRVFAGICRTVKGLKKARFGAIGARTGPFNTVRYSEKVLESSGISVETIDLSEIFGMADRIKKGSKDLGAKIKQISNYITSKGIPKTAIEKMARFALVVEHWIKDNDLNGTAIQCWTSMQEFFGIVPCTVMSSMSNRLVPSACEVDITGTLSMYALQLASEKPAGLFDWNNNYQDDPDSTVLFHCGNIPASMIQSPKMDFQEIIAGSVGKENTYGTVTGRIKPGPLTFLRLTTDSAKGLIKGYLGEGMSTDDPLDTFGTYGVVNIEDLQELLYVITNSGFEHHVAASFSLCGDILAEALGNYLDYEIYLHNLL